MSLNWTMNALKKDFEKIVLDNTTKVVESTTGVSLADIRKTVVKELLEREAADTEAGIDFPEYLKAPKAIDTESEKRFSELVEKYLEDNNLSITTEEKIVEWDYMVVIKVNKVVREYSFVLNTTYKIDEWVMSEKNIS